MPDYKQLTKDIKQNKRISEQVIDQFLLYFAADQDGVDARFDQRIKPFRHILPDMPKGWKDYLKSQYIAHQVFKSGGLINKYLDHSRIRALHQREQTLLQEQAMRPWRYSFAEVTDNPHSDFYTMRDLFTGQQYLLYSQSMSQMLLTMPDICTWFNLVGFGEQCAQTYGSVCYFRSFGYDDITFFARELNPDLEDDTQIDAHINDHPLPYIMLWSGATLPMLASGEHTIRHMAARYADENFSTDPFNKQFRVEYAEGAYRLSLDDWCEFPHYSVAYFDERDALLHLTAMTRTGFKELVTAVNGCGYDLPMQAHDNVSPGMLHTASNILRQDITLNPFDHHFEPETDDEQLAEVNYFLELLMDALNNNRQPDIRQMATKAGIDYETAADITDQILNKFRNF